VRPTHRVTLRGTFESTANVNVSEHGDPLTAKEFAVALAKADLLEKVNFPGNMEVTGGTAVELEPLTAEERLEAICEVLAFSNLPVGEALDRVLALARQGVEPPKEEAGEEQVCPRRGEGPVLAPPPDYWQRGRWSKEVGSSGRWTGPGMAPRTCSFCGGAHPDDVVGMVRGGGWRLGSTDKAYKYYLNPADERRKPVPPVKVYLQHFDDEARASLNAALEDAS